MSYHEHSLSQRDSTLMVPDFETPSPEHASTIPEIGLERLQGCNISCAFRFRTPRDQEEGHQERPRALEALLKIA